MSEKIAIKNIDLIDELKAQQSRDEYYARALRDRAKIQPKHIKGFYQNIRDLNLVGLLALFIILPWITWSAQQAFLIDLGELRFNIFGTSFFINHDMIYLVLFLIIAALALFFFTTLWGRVWCGYLCPQTIWTRVFLWVEYWAEGDRNKRLKLDKSPWTFEKIRKRGLKHLIWLLIAFVTAYTFIGFLSPIRDMTIRLLNAELKLWETLSITFFTFATYINAAIIREKFCKYMCPYARFQSVMFDADTYTVTYDYARGEPRKRGNRRKKQDKDTETSPAGDCIDCGLCVQVCPVGIDIRQGLQYECIDCAACVDVCNDVMTHIKKPKNLIGYHSENEIEGKITHWNRPRITGFATILVICTLALGIFLMQRKPLSFDIIRGTKTFQKSQQNTVENNYHFKIMNIAGNAGKYKITPDLPPELTYRGPSEITIDKYQTIELDVLVDVANDDKKHINKISFTISSIDNPTISLQKETRFIVIAPTH